MDKAIEAIKGWLADGARRSDYISHDKWMRRAAAAKAIDAITPKLPDGVYWRCTNRREEIDDVRRGEKIVSRDHRDGTQEHGMSVARHLAYGIQGYKWCYQVSGRVAGCGADGEPILMDVVPIGDLMSTNKAVENDDIRDRCNALYRELADATSASYEQVSYLAHLF